jgi:signal transduction histidine kinase
VRRPISLEAVPLEPLIQEIAEDVGLSPYQLDVASDAIAFAHPDLLRQAVENLVENARKHASGDGLRVSARREAPDATLVEVSDTGPGMSKEEAERVVDRFFRSGSRSADGFGLGLSIAREVAHAVGGRLEIQTAPAAGTTVRLRLRAPQEAA